jgi:hypothetical protein
MTARPAADATPIAIDAAGAVVVNVRVIPRARQTRLDGCRSNAVLVRLAAPPVDGLANAALIDFLARHLECPRRCLQLVAGETSRDKRIRIAGIPRDVVAARLLVESR